MHVLVDSHVHLDHEAFAADRATVLARARQVGVHDFVVPAVEFASWARIRMLCASQSGIHPAYGLHPVFLDRHAPEHLEALSRCLDDGHAVAVGEIGLDFHSPELDRDLQRFYFTQQLRLASERNLPVIVHAREAQEEVGLILRNSNHSGGVVHSFSGSEQQAKRLWDSGFLIGIGGPVTYDRARRLRRIVANMPLEHLLLESDAPDQPDAAHRGQRNEPARITEILRCVAALRGESEQEVAAVTSANARHLFRLG